MNSLQSVAKAAFSCAVVALVAACGGQEEHLAPAVVERDSVSVMRSYGVNTLISDSGVIKYRLVSERWEVNDVMTPSRWIFEKGLFFEQFDEHFNVQAYIQCDTAYYYDKKRLWELRGRVHILNGDGLTFDSEQLYWDEAEREFYSFAHSRLVTPERTLEGRYFRSDDKITRYYVSDTSGSFERGDLSGESDTTAVAADSTALNVRPSAAPQRKTAQPAQPERH